MSDINITIPGGTAKRIKTSGKYCEQDIVVTAEGENTEAAFEAGKQAEYKAFWDSFLADTTSFAWRFAGKGWNDYTFNPDRDIVFSVEMSNYCFAYNLITDLESILQRNNVVLDTSRTKRLDNLFYYCKRLVCVPEIVINEDITMANHMFSECTALHTIRKLVFPNKSSFNINNMFNNCSALVNLTIGGTIAVTGIDLHWSTLLSRESITSVINALSDTTTGMTITLSQIAVETAFTDAEWSALEATKSNWTITLA